MSNLFHFHYGKAAQAVAVLLRNERQHRMNYYRLLKLLYIADRESVREHGRPIVGGRLIAMERGPLHSAAYDLVKGKAPETQWWGSYFQTDRFEIEMTRDPGNGDLSKSEIDLLNRVSMEHETEDEWAVGKFTHGFGEFVRHAPEQGKCATIPFADLLEALGMSGSTESITQDAKNKAVFDSVFGA